MLRRTTRILSAGVLLVAFSGAFAQGVVISSTVAPAQKPKSHPAANANPNPELGGSSNADLAKAMFQAAAPKSTSKLIDDVDKANDAKDIADTQAEHGSSDAAVALFQKGVDAGVEKGVAITGEALGLPPAVADREAKAVTAAGRYIRDNTKVGQAVQDAEYDGAVATGNAILKGSDAAGKAFNGSTFDLTPKVNPRFDSEAAHALDTVPVLPSVTRTGSVTNLSAALKADADQQAAIARAKEEAARQAWVAQEQEREAEAEQAREAEEQQERQNARYDADHEAWLEEHDAGRAAWQEDAGAVQEALGAWQAQVDAASEEQAGWDEYQQQSSPVVFGGAITTPSGNDSGCGVNTTGQDPSPGDTSGLLPLCGMAEAPSGTDPDPAQSPSSTSTPSSPSVPSASDPSPSSGSTQ